MFFMLRSAFWLGIVFTSLPWNGESSPGSPVRMIETARSAALASAASAGSYCSASPLECLSAAQKLHELFERVAAEPEMPSEATPAANLLSQQDKMPRRRASSPR